MAVRVTVTGNKLWQVVPETGLEVMQDSGHNANLWHDGPEIVGLGRLDTGEWRIRAAPPARQAEAFDEGARQGALALMGFPYQPHQLPALLFLDTDGTLANLADESGAPTALSDRRVALIRALLSVALSRIPELRPEGEV